jgi:hypothetical protein
MGPTSRLLKLASSLSNTFKFAKLNGENYTLWSEHMQVALQSWYLWLIVTGDKTCLDKPADWKLENTFFFFFFWIIILYRNRIYYMYCAL